MSDIAISRDIFGHPDADDDLHGPPHDHPHLPAHLPSTDPLTVMHRAAGIRDPRTRAAALTARLAVAQQWVEWGSVQRDLAVLAMRAEGASYEEVAGVLGVSKSRAQQICRRLRHKHPEGGADWRRESHGHDGQPLG